MSRNMHKLAVRQQAKQKVVSPLAAYVNQTNGHNTTDEERLSETSGDTVDSWLSTGSRGVEFEEGVNWEDELLESIEMLEERRTSTREQGLSQLVRLMTHKYAASVLDSHQDSLLDLLSKSIKKEKSYKENQIAAKVMLLLFVTLGESRVSMYQSVMQLLKYTITNTASAEVKSACIKTLCLACFISASGMDAVELIGFFVQIIKTNGSSVNAPNDSLTIAAALKAYGLLYAGLWGDSKRNSHAAREEFDRIMPMHMIHLESPSMDVRVASGENIALMFETLKIGHGRATGEWGEASESDEDYEGSEDYEDLDKLLESLNTLARDATRWRGKAERKTQRSVFRNISRTVEYGERVQLKLKIKKQPIFFSSWSKIHQLQAFRDILAEGLHVHFQENGLLQSLFDFEPEVNVIKSRPGSAMSLNTGGSDTDTGVSKGKRKFKKKRGKDNRMEDLLRIG